MDAKRWQKIDAIIDAALEIPVSEREKFVVLNCKNDETLEKEVLALLGAHKNSDQFLQNSAMNLMAKAIADDQPDVFDNSFLDKTFGHYRIESMLGAGGMGEVYLATDNKLRRKVALKILPAEYTSNDERVKRFQLEARAVSALNHPNIVTIYDVGNIDGVNFIATEYVEGKTLRELVGSNLKLKNVLAIIIQSCEALSAAHNAGIIHRDIKPENIMIRPDGYVKILDFGLAKLSEIDPNTMKSFTRTAKGVIIGTPAYMSPEQVSDENVDHRTDLWSIGVVAYELLTNVNPFKKENRQATFQAILAQEPPLASSLNNEISPELDQILVKALEKDADFSYQTASDLRADLKRIKREVDSSPSLRSTSGSLTQKSEAASARRPFLLLPFTFLLLPLLAFGIWYFVFRADKSDAVDWSKATNIQLTENQGTEFFPSLAPDGKSFVYASDAGGNFDIYTQRVGGKKVENLTADSTAEDTQPAFSPDGERIAFRSERAPAGIYVMGASGENLRRVADFGFHPSWSPDGREIVVSTFGRDEPSVRANGEQSLAIITLETGAKRELINANASFPAWSPSGKRIAYWFYTGTFSRRDIATVSANGGEPVIVAKDFAVSNWNPVWSPDGKFLYFVSSKGGNQNFWRGAIDESSGAVLGEPEPVVTPSKYSRHLNFSRDGKRMIYVQTNNQSNIQAAEFDANKEKIVGEPFWITQGDREILRAELSPDGKRFQMRIVRRTQDDIVTVSRDGTDWRDVTDDAPFDRFSRWSPDGKKIAFSSDRGGGSEIWTCNPDGTDLRQISFANDARVSPGFPVWSPDGKQLAVHHNTTTYILDLSRNWSEQTPPKLPPTENGGYIVVWDWSPDGKKLGGVIYEGDLRFIGFYSFETNRYEKIVENVNLIPAWLPDSRGFVYGENKKIFLADIETKKTKELVSNLTAQLRTPFVSRDGRLLYYTAYIAESDIWLLDIAPSR